MSGTETARFRRIDVRIHADAKYRKLSGPQPNAKDLYKHLLECGHDRSVPGVLPVGIGQLSDEMGWPMDATLACWKEIEAAELAEGDLEARLIWIPNRVLGDPPRSPKNVAHWKRWWKEVPECALKERIWASAVAYCESRGASFIAALGLRSENASKTRSKIDVRADTKQKAESRKQKAEEEEEPALFPLEAPTPPSSESDLPEQVKELWNEIAPPAGLAAVQRLSDTRRKHVRARHAGAGGLKSLTEWRSYFERIAKSSFCRGLGQRPNDRGTAWRADFDFAIASDNNVLKVLEGKYDDRRPEPVNRAPALLDLDAHYEAQDRLEREKAALRLRPLDAHRLSRAPPSSAQLAMDESWCGSA